MQQDVGGSLCSVVWRTRGEASGEAAHPTASSSPLLLLDPVLTRLRATALSCPLD